MKSKKKVALVTGGAKGIGRAIARRLASHGMHVVIADMDTKAMKRTASQIGASATAIVADVSDEKSVKAMIGRIRSELGRLDLLVNNAGIAAPFAGPIEKLTLRAWERVIATNLTGAFICAKQSARMLRKSGGSIINIASTRALQSEPNTEAYSASKGGLVALTHSLAMSLSPQVRVNCISPGWIYDAEGASYKLKSADHAQHPVGRVGRPEDIASLVEHLASDDAGFITGANFVVDGGMTRRMIYVD